MAGLGLMNRRRANQGSPIMRDISIDDYVQDSILMMMDGIGLGNVVPTIWKDRVRDVTFVNVGAAYVGNDGFDCATGYLRAEEAQSILHSTNRTMELLVTAHAAVTDIAVVFVQAGKCFCFAVNPSANQSITIGNYDTAIESTAFTNPFTQQGTYHIVVANDKMYVNGVECPANGKGSLMTRDTTQSSIIGRRATGNPFNGIVHAIRIHNRVLTEAEILQNMKVDMARYNTRNFV